MTAVITLSPAELVLLVARACIGAGELPGKVNDSPFVRRVQAATGNKPPDPWCASFEAYAGTLALGSRWPVKKTASCPELYAWGKAEGLIVPHPAPGDIALYWYAKYQRYAHTGLVERVDADGRIDTIEGNTNDDGGREGWLVLEKTRTVHPQDAFLRWEGLVR